MAYFPHQNPSFLLESVFLPDTPISISGLFEEGCMNTSADFPYSSSYQSIQEVPMDVKILECRDNGPSVTEKQKTDCSSIAIDPECSDQINQKETQVQEKRKNIDGSSWSTALSKGANEAKLKKHNSNSNELKSKENNSKAHKKNRTKVAEMPPTGYVYVRARRGEATDSRSLAERVRRKRNSERMKVLQGLVPGCNKNTNMTLMLDEIINYVKYLQHQVEFLSLNLAYVNPMFCESGMDHFLKPEVVPVVPSMQHSIPTPSITFADTTTAFTTENSYPLLDTSVCFLHQQEERPNASSQQIR